MRFEGKVALVTGAATGIGAATAVAFGAEGANVVLSDVNQSALAERVGEIQAAGGQALAVLADASKAADAQRTVAEAVAAFGGIDYLVASAGIQTYGTAVDTDEDTWDRTLAVNAKGVYLAAKYCIPEMAKTRRRRHRQCGVGARLVQPAQRDGLFGVEGRGHRDDANDGD